METPIHPTELIKGKSYQFVMPIPAINQEGVDLEINDINATMHPHTDKTIMYPHRTEFTFESMVEENNGYMIYSNTGGNFFISSYCINDISNIRNNGITFKSGCFTINKE